MVKKCASFLIGMVLPWLSTTAAASEAGAAAGLDLTATWLGIFGVIAFALAYALVIAEEYLHLRKSKPVMVAAGIIWILVAIAFSRHGDTTSAHDMIRHNILEYAELLLFLLPAMTYVNTMEERDIFSALRSWLISRGFSLKAIFWITGLLAFFISPVADNLTTALVMSAVVLAVARDNAMFVTLGCINIVVAANAGGAYSPFGDITTLMVWQKGKVEFWQFFSLFLPSLVNWVVPAFLMALFLPQGAPKKTGENIRVKRGGFVVVGLFFCTIIMAVLFHSLLHLPSMLGMMTGLGILKLYGYWLKQQYYKEEELFAGEVQLNGEVAAKPGFDIFHQLQRAEWDTLMFFYGVILCVGGLSAFGYLNITSNLMYDQLGPSWANILVGICSAVIDNIPIMFAVLTMSPDMDVNQWLLVTLTAGVGGSLLSVGSAAGVALMGQARGIYTFFSHLKWTWAVALGYVASIATHVWVNGVAF